MSKRSSSKDTSREQLVVRGATAPSGVQWIKVRQGKKRVWIPRAEFMTNPKQVKVRLASSGIVLMRGAYAKFEQQVDEITRFPSKALIEQPGWSGPCFALPTGEIFTPPGIRAVAVFEPDDGSCARAGTLSDWLREVADPLAGQDLAVFMLMATFLPPLLKLTNRTGNFGFELVGPPGTGKTVLLQLMASTVGRALDNTGRPYWSTCNTTVNALERKVESRSDLPLLLDDATMFAAEQNGVNRGNQFKSFIFRLAQAETKDSLTGPKQRRFRCAYFLTSNLPLADVVVGVAEREAGATADRLLSLDISLRQNGIFDFVPEQHDDATAFARALIAGMAAYYGTAMRRFLHELVNHRDRNESALRATIAAKVDAFIDRVKANRADGSATRVAEAFGLVMAAGQLARHYGVLPQSYDCEAAAISAYRLYLASTQRVTREQRLLAYANDASVLDMDAGKLTCLSDRQFQTVPGVMRTHKSSHREFLVVPSTFKRAFPDWRAVLRDPAVKRYLVRDGRHSTVKRALRKGHPHDRVYCFRLPR